jgi:PAS domain S-box-containing protein
MKDQSLRILIVEDSEDDTLLIIRNLKKGGYSPVYERVETTAAMKKALQEKQWDIILCDYKMPEFDAPSAIALLKEANIDIPLIIVSGTMGEETAVECMRLGAQDYIMKGNLFRLCPAIARELKDVEVKNRQKQTESQREAVLEALRQSEEKYRSILETIQEGYFEVDFAGNFTFFNDSLCRNLGYSKEELMGMNNRQYTDKEHSKKLFQAFNKVYNTGEPTEGFDWQIIRKDGTKRSIEASVSLQKDSSGKPTGFRGIARDVTERKQAEEKLLLTLESLRKAFGTIIKVMVSAVEMRDPYTSGHQIRSADLARAIATEMGLPQDKINGIRLAGSIHDIGKLSIPAEILSKPSKLTNIEFSLIKEHSRVGYEMLKDVESPWPLAQIVYQHHERIDGSGYPKNLKGDEIIIEASIMAVADVVEAMASHRPYRPALGIKAALEEIKKNKGILYDEAVADTCLRLFLEKNYQIP